MPLDYAYFRHAREADYAADVTPLTFYRLSMPSTLFPLFCSCHAIDCYVADTGIFAKDDGC